ncbi:MAG: nuclear transport factor 2 family protein [Ottowia sp.]|uniref:nuclear transport factor 2 family protein n=1 Tax=unclassified Ottowia TaxID=2645081 RepID=UPI003C2EB657
MPVVAATLLPVYPAEVEQRLVQRLALATRSVIAAPAAGTTVYVKHASTYLRDGRVFTGGGSALADASALARSFLEAMQARDLEAAQRYLAPSFVMHFPGSGPLHRLEELVEFSRPRYKFVGKTFERFEESWGDERTVVFCTGTLHGEWLDGSTFEGIRFVDRFEIADGLLQRQDVWNDLELHRP